MKIEYDKPIEVSKGQYHMLMSFFPGIVAGQINGNKYFIKVWVMQHAKNIQEEIDYYGMLTFQMNNK